MPNGGSDVAFMFSVEMRLPLRKSVEFKQVQHMSRALAEGADCRLSGRAQKIDAKAVTKPPRAGLGTHGRPSLATKTGTAAATIGISKLLCASCVPDA